jgi:putative salt-induced outer membrane protein YdiY
MPALSSLKRVIFMSLVRTVAMILILASSWQASGDEFFVGSVEESPGGGCSKEVGNCENRWQANVELGYVAVTGNSETTSVNGAFKAKYEIHKWRHAAELKTIFGTESGVTKTEKYFAQVKSDYKFNSRAYGYLLADYDKSRFSGFDYQTSATLGMGYRFIGNAKHTLDAEMGFGYRQSKIEDTVIVSGQGQTESVARLAGQYVWVLSKTAKFEQKMSTEIGEDNTISKFLSSLTANINEHMAMSVSYEIKKQSEVPLGSKDTDTVTSFTLVYNF